MLTAHPTEARRRAVVTAILRISELLARLDGARGGERARGDRRAAAARRSTCCGGRRCCRHTQPDPLDEVRTAMAVVRRDDVPRRAGDLPGARHARSAARHREPARRWPARTCGSAAGSAATATATRTSPRRSPGTAIGIQADHVLRALGNACSRVGRDADRRTSTTTPPSDALRDASPPPAPRMPELVGRDRQALAGRAAPAGRCCTPRSADRRDPRARRRPRPTPRPTSCSPTCAPSRSPWPPRARPGRRTGESSTSSGRSRRSASTSPSWRSASTPSVHETALAEVRAGGPLSSELTEEVLETLRRRRVDPASGSASAPAAATSSRFTRSAADIAAVHELAGLRSATRRPSWTSSRCSRPARTSSAPRPSSTGCWRSRPSGTAWTRRAAAWRSCSATPTRPSSSARPARPSACTTRRRRSPRGRPATT